MYGLSDCRSLLFMPAHRERAVAKARGLPCDAIVLDLEDAVSPADKAHARDAAVAELGRGLNGRLALVRANGADSGWQADDLAALANAPFDHLVLPKVEHSDEVAAAADAVGRPVVAMIESPRGLLDAPRIAAAPGCAGLFAGTNDLAHALKLPAGGSRAGLVLALQTIILAAVLADVPAFDGVFNRLDDPAGLAAECEEGAAFGFRGKTLIHPGQIETANRVFLGDAAALAADLRLLAEAAAEGAVRHDGAMVEAMHVAAARARIARARALGVVDAG